MKAKKNAAFFLIIFSIFLVTPSIINMIENTADISYFFDIAEEEKKGEPETSENTLMLTHHPENSNEMHNLPGQLHQYCCTPDNYLEIVPDKICPPPEHM